MTGMPAQLVALAVCAQLCPAGAAPVAAWSSDQVEAGAVLDSALGSAATVRGAPTLAPGVQGLSVKFDGVKDLVSIPDSEIISFPGATFSVSLWANVYALLRGQQMIVGKNVYSANQREWGLMIDEDDHFRFYLQHSGWQTVGSLTVPTPGDWYHLGVTLDSGHAKLYVNGKLEGEADLGAPLPETDAPLTIGGINDGGRLRQMLFGCVDEVRLYPAVLTPEEVLTLSDKETVPHPVPDAQADRFALWDPEKAMPRAAETVDIPGVEHYMIYKRDPETDGGYTWLHGVALAWHRGKLYASFGHNKGPENTGSEEARVTTSEDGGRTWGEVSTIDAGEGPLAVSHGVFLNHADELWAFHGSFYNHLERVHTRAYLLDDATGKWQPRGVVVGDGFWPLQEPTRMDDGNYIMAGIRVSKGYDVSGDLPAVAISHGGDLTQWDLVVIPAVAGLGIVWGESSVIVDGPKVLNIARWGGRAIALGAISEDYGRTWTAARPSNLPMAGSKPYTGTLSDGRRYLIGTTTADGGHQRTPLTMALAEPGEDEFDRILCIRREAWMAYPYVIEHEGKLYVGYSVAVARGGNQNNAELSVIPLEAMAVEQ